MGVILRKSVLKHQTVSQFYNDAVKFWDTMIEYFPQLKEFKEISPGKSVRLVNIAILHGGHLLFRPVGLEIASGHVYQRPQHNHMVQCQKYCH